MMINETTEITTDGKTVWINAPICIGRFCPSSYEVTGLKDEDVDAGAPLTVRIIWSRQTSAWNNFVTMMDNRHSVKIPDSFRPSWVKPDRNVDSVRF